MAMAENDCQYRCTTAVAPGGLTIVDKGGEVRDGGTDGGSTRTLGGGSVQEVESELRKSSVC